MISLDGLTHSVQGAISWTIAQTLLIMTKTHQQNYVKNMFLSKICTFICHFGDKDSVQTWSSHLIFVISTCKPHCNQPTTILNSNISHEGNYEIVYTLCINIIGIEIKIIFVNVQVV